MNKFIFTCGDTNGIGLEIVIKSLNKIFNSSDEFYLVCPKSIFLKNVSLTKPKFKYVFHNAIPKGKIDRGTVHIITIQGGYVSNGKPSKTSGSISFESLQLACEFALRNKHTALITAPISKQAWKLNSIHYEGHTDFLGDKFDVAEPLMLFYSRKMICALTTIHKPIQDVPKLVTRRRLKSVFNSLERSLKRDFNISKPKIAVLGLNPHAGEQGGIGKEEVRRIVPVISQFENFYGPFVPDAFFGKQLYKKYDAVLGMYHDQVLIPFKMLDFEKGVNFTANLPIVRTSPDHGTAYDIAYKGIANPSSIIEAYRLAKKVIRNRSIS